MVRVLAQAASTSTSTPRSCRCRREPLGDAVVVAIVQVPAAEVVFILLVAKHEVGGGQHGGGDRYSRLLRTAPELTRVVTCSRTSRNARWTRRVRTMPTARTKAGREHRVRLCSHAIKIVDEARRLGALSGLAGAVPGLVFPSQRGKTIADARLSGVLCQRAPETALF